MNSSAVKLGTGHPQGGLKVGTHQGSRAVGHTRVAERGSTPGDQREEAHQGSREGGVTRGSERGQERPSAGSQWDEGGHWKKDSESGKSVQKGSTRERTQGGEESEGRTAR